MTWGINLGLTDRADLYTLDAANRDQLMSSAPLMWDWSRQRLRGQAPRGHGGLGEAPERLNGNGNGHVHTCDWYHGTWQLLRLLNMVAVPPWYAFYNDALTRVLRAKPNANVLISALADYGMLATLHEAVVAAGASPTITICDICETPLLLGAVVRGPPRLRGPLHPRRPADEPRAAAGRVRPRRHRRAAHRAPVGGQAADRRALEGVPEPGRRGRHDRDDRRADDARAARRVRRARTPPARRAPRALRGRRRHARGADRPLRAVRRLPHAAHARGTRTSCARCSRASTSSSRRPSLPASA